MIYTAGFDGYKPTPGVDSVRVIWPAVLHHQTGTLADKRRPMIIRGRLRNDCHLVSQATTTGPSGLVAHKTLFAFPGLNVSDDRDAVISRLCRDAVRFVSMNDGLEPSGRDATEKQFASPNDVDGVYVCRPNGIGQLVDIPPLKRETRADFSDVNVFHIEAVYVPVFESIAGLATLAMRQPGWTREKHDKFWVPVPPSNAAEVKRMVLHLHNAGLCRYRPWWAIFHPTSFCLRLPVWFYGLQRHDEV